MASASKPYPRAPPLQGRPAGAISSNFRFAPPRGLSRLALVATAIATITRAIVTGSVVFQSRSEPVTERTRLRA